MIRTQYPTLTFHKANGEEIVLPRPLAAPDHVLFDARWFDNEVGRALGLSVVSLPQVSYFLVDGEEGKP